MIQETDAVVIGAGPVGLFQVFQLGLQGLAAHIIDALPYAGGQCVELYGDKPIYDIPGVPVCTGRELAALLQQQIAPFQPQWHLNAQVAALQTHADTGRFHVTTTQGATLSARAVFIAAGVGAFVPRHSSWKASTGLWGPNCITHGYLPRPRSKTSGWWCTAVTMRPWPAPWKQQPPGKPPT